MEKINYEKFSYIYEETLTEIYKFWNNEMQDYIAQHNKSWSRNDFDFFNYLKASKLRYYKAYSMFDNKSKTICDVGGFFGVFSLVLVKLGYEVYMTEALKYYTSAFDGLFNFLKNSNVIILDLDPFEASVLPNDAFDEITTMAVIEHYPHSLKNFMENISSASRTNSVIIEVPNIAYLPNRLKLLKGDTPLPNIDMIYESSIPFTGHHHEFTIKELDVLVEKIDYKIIKQEMFNYSNNYKSFAYMLRNPIKGLIMNLYKNTRECIIIKASYDQNK